MTAWKLFLISWDFAPSIVIGCALLWGIYLFAARFKFNRKTVIFTLGMLVLFLALVSPVDVLGEDYLFTLHMVQHIMLFLIVPALLISGLPDSFVRSWLRFPFIAWLERILSIPPLAIAVALGDLWIWHLPALYNAALQNESVHIFEHLTFLVTGSILWWPVFKPVPEGRLAPLPAIVYMAIASTINAILGITFTWSSTPFYSSYAHPPDELGALSMIRDQWGFNQLADQRMGGAIMWAGGGAVFLWAMMVMMKNWFEESEKDIERVDEWRAANVESR